MRSSSCITASTRRRARGSAARMRAAAMPAGWWPGGCQKMQLTRRQAKPSSHWTRAARTTKRAASSGPGWCLLQRE
eukprot:12552357-Alexandrium_andersonii.AAC.1